MLRATWAIWKAVESPPTPNGYFSISDLHWISQAAAEIPFECSAKIRYRQQDTACVVTAVKGTTAEVEFEQPQRAITPGQALVFYLGEQCLGGGTIEMASNPS